MEAVAIVPRSEELWPARELPVVVHRLLLGCPRWSYYRETIRLVAPTVLRAPPVSPSSCSYPPQFHGQAGARPHLDEH